MTRDEADEIAVYLSAAYGPWSEMKKAVYSDAFLDLDFRLTKEAAEQFVKTQPGGRWPVPGDIRQAANQLAGRSRTLRLTDERESGRPLPKAEGLAKLKEMREALELKAGARRAGLESLGDIIGKPKGESTP